MNKAAERIEWQGIPEKYWPSTDKPWRVTWGFGMCADFSTEEEARKFYTTLSKDLAPHEPFNAVEL